MGVLGWSSDGRDEGVGRMNDALLTLTAAALTGLMSRTYCDTPESIAQEAVDVARAALRLLEEAK